MDEIEFEGTTVKLDKNGYYKCPFKCGYSGYPVKKWKTKRGFLKHAENCSNRPSLIKLINEEYDSSKITYDKIKKEIIEKLKWKIGDEINYVHEIVVKPTHEEKWGRMVKVRYESVKRFESRKEIINKIDGHFSSGLVDPYLIERSLMVNDRVPIISICSSEEEAKEKAKKMQEGHDEYLRFSSLVR